ncbi:MAG: 5-methylcytosine-specific restriction endonuclease system specificity protein McrC [Bulleidia sp.]|nr:5-methylcytosine-specific restriction endonuclease system specificity protein McrC [Bulleidia sp.]
MTIEQEHILVRNIYYMLSYAFISLKKEEDERIAGEDFDHALDLFAAILSKGISRQLKQGLYREYINHMEEMSTMHGKICMQETIRNRVQRRQTLTCEYDDLSENNLLNQILKTTCMLLIRSKDVKTEYKDELKREMLYFSEVNTVSPYSIPWSSIRLQRNNRSYQLLLGICQLILEGMLLTTEDGEMKLAKFVDDQRFSHLYEKFILEYYRQEHPELKANASQISWALDSEEDDLLPVMQSDVMLENKTGDKVLIIDAKCYGHSLARNQYDNQTVHSANLYQIFTYVKNKDAELKDKEHTVAGMLLYAKTDEDLYPDNTYRMSGNTISVKTLDLSQDFKNISGQLDRIVKEYFLACSA